MPLTLATAIFNLPDHRVVETEIPGFGQRRIHVESTTESGCPACRGIGTRRHSRRRQRIRGIPVAGPVKVIWFKRRFFCDESECARRTFFEATTEVPRLARSTRRLQNTLVSAVIESGRAATEAAAAYGVSWWLVQRALDTAAARLPDVDRLRPRMPGIDEHRFRSVRFFKDPETRVWKRFEPRMSTIVDPDTGQVLGVGTLTTFCSLSKVTVFEMRKLYVFYSRAETPRAITWLTTGIGMKLKNKLLGGLATASVFLLSACGSGTPSGSSGTAISAAGTLQKVRVGVLPLVATAPIYLGEEKGFFKEEGLDLELQSSEGGAAIVPSVFSGGFQFGYSNTLSILVAADKGLDLRFVTNGASSATEGDADATAVVVQADSDIRSPADLAGKRVSVNTLSNIGDTTIRYVVESDGGDQSSIEFVEVPFPEAPAALANQQVDAAWIAEPFLTEALSHGARVVTYNYRDTDPNLDIGGYFASANTIESNPELVEKFTKAMNKSLAYAGENPDEVREIVGTYTKISEELRQKMILPGFRVEFDQKAASVLAEAATKYGTLSKTSDLEKLLPHK